MTARIPRAMLEAARTVRHQLFRRAEPRILSNSYHKSGTHLLVGLVEQLSGARAYGRRAYWHSLGRTRVDEARRDTLDRSIDKLSQCMPGEVYRGHLAYAPKLAGFIADKGFKHIFIYRDPRDTVVSLFFWWRHPGLLDTWPYRYFQSLNSDDERLRFLIEGWPPGGPGNGFPEEVDYPDVGRRFEEFCGWFSEPNCLAVRYEDLVNPERKDAAYLALARHILTGASAAELSAAAARMAVGADPARSRTFRKGGTGDWREVLHDDHLELLKRYAGPMLVRLGYEQDLEW